jgi:hypothetical protein
MLFSYHANQRLARRNLSEADAAFVLEHGRRYYAAGALHVFLGRRNLPRERTLYQRYAHLEGTVLVMSAGVEKQVITVYRNRRALRTIRSKKPYDARRRLV